MQQETATQYNTLQHTATHHNTQQLAVTFCTHRNTPQRTATHYSTSKTRCRLGQLPRLSFFFPSCLSSVYIRCSCVQIDFVFFTQVDQYAAQTPRKLATPMYGTPLKHVNLSKMLTNFWKVGDTHDWDATKTFSLQGNRDSQKIC